MGRRHSITTPHSFPPSAPQVAFLAPASSLSRVLRGSFETKDAPGSRLPKTLTGRPRTLSVSQTVGASDRRAQAGLEPRIGRPPCSPATFPDVTLGEGARVCGSTQPPRPQGEQKGPQAIPTKTQPSLQTITELGETTVAVVEQLPRFRPWCGPELQVMRPRARGLWCRGDGRALHPAPPCPARPGEEGRDPGTAGGNPAPYAD